VLRKHHSAAPARGGQTEGKGGRLAGWRAPWGQEARPLISFLVKSFFNEKIRLALSAAAAA